MIRRVWLSMLALVPLASCGSDEVLIPTIDACETETASSQGCAFSVTRLLHQRVNEGDPDGIVVTNPSLDTTTEVQFIRGNYPQTPVHIPPGGMHVFEIPERAIGGESTAMEAGVALRIVSEHPVSAYLIAPLTNRTANESSLLIPDTALGDTYVVASYASFFDPNHPLSEGEPSYFTIIGQADATTVHFRPPVDTAAGDGIEAVAAGQEGVFTLDAGDVARIAAVPQADISGTVVEADAPVWVAGGVGCAYIPVDLHGHCDHLQEVMRPVTQWANDYPAVPSPPRANEPHLWRVFAGAPNVTVTIEPGGSSFVLEGVGDFEEIAVPNGEVLWFHADGPILPMQYLVSSDIAGGKGDPSMVQAIATPSWMQRYVVSTGLRFSENYLQIIRFAGDADVFVDGILVEGYDETMGLEIANVLVDEGTHVVDGEQPIGLFVYAYSNAVDGTKYASYAMPGGFAR